MVLTESHATVSTDIANLAQDFFYCSNKKRKIKLSY